MRIFKTKLFARFARRERISDGALCEAVSRVEKGLVDADLGGGVIKQRIARQGQGRSGGGAGGSGPPDLQRMLSRLPNSTLADLQKADAVMIVATEGAGSDAATAITLLAGVDAILTASPNRSASLLSPWSLGAPSAEGEGAQQ